MIRRVQSPAFWLFAVLVVSIAPVRAGEAATPSEGHPPIPIAFELKEAGFVTLVIEDSHGRRVRNLIAETPSEAGPHVVYWDGLDESGILPDPTVKFIYQVRGKLVDVGEYRVRGLFRKELNLRYEFSVYSPGNPPWHTADRTGGWLADHTPQATVLSLPKGSPHGKQAQMLLGSPVAEDGYSLAWVDLSANKLYSGKASGWRGAYALARDAGPNPRKDIHAYSAFLEKGIQVFGLQGEGEDYTQGRYIEQGRGVVAVPSVSILNYSEAPYTQAGTHGGNFKGAGIGLDLAVFDHVVAVSLPDTNEVLFADAAESQQTAGKSGRKKSVGRIVGKSHVARPTGLMADTHGRLYVLSEKTLKRFDVDWKAAALKNETVLISGGLEDPRRLTADEKGNLYISDWGESHQIKVFSPDGKFLRAIGRPGGLQMGHYDPNRMSNPQGIAISADGHLWVAEYTYVPKRLSIWTLDGKLVRAIYGSPRYGGGGTLDAWDRTRLFYGYPGCMEFRLDWDKGENRLDHIWLGPIEDDIGFVLRNKNGGAIMPERPVHLDGRIYLTNQGEHAPERIAGIWLLRDDKAVLVAAAGDLSLGPNKDFADFFAANLDALNKRMPKGVAMIVRKTGNSADDKGKITFTSQEAPNSKGKGKAKGRSKDVQVLQAWSDLNCDGKPQVEEFTFFVGQGERGVTSLTVDNKLAILTASGVRLEPSGFAPAGAPIYDAAKAVRLTKDYVASTVIPPRQAILGHDGNLIVTGGPIEGFKDGQRAWYYHSQWAGGFAKGKSPRPQYPGQLLNTMRLLGPMVACPNDKLEIWGINGDYGQLFFLTTDGLYVATLFKDSRTVDHYWPTPAKRGALLNDVTLQGECYGPTISQTADGKVYLQAGKNKCSLIRLDGLDTVRRLEVGTLKITPQLLVQAKDYQAEQSARLAASRPAAEKAPARESLNVAIRKQAPTVDGKLDDWKAADWATIDDRSRAAVGISGNTLYVAYHMDYEYRLENSPDSLDSLFKGGPALDLMIGADPGADPQRKTPMPGDIRLLVTEVNKKIQAAVFRAVVPGTKEPVKYVSPVGSATIDQVEDVSGRVVLVGGKHADKTDQMRRSVPVIRRYADYEFSVPLSVLGLTPKDGLTIRGDVGLLLGQAGATADRVYWHNKSASMTSDLPTEARLTPSLWGQWKFQAQK